MSRWRGAYTALTRLLTSSCHSSEPLRGPAAGLQVKYFSLLASAPAPPCQAILQQKLLYLELLAPWKPSRRCLFTLPEACSKKYQERRLIRFSQQQLFDVVAEVERYKEFVPWCQRSVVTDKTNANELYAELEVGFRMFVERYTSQVILQEPSKVISKVSDSTLFNHLDTIWEFQPGPTADTCWLSFKTDFQFKSPLYSQVASVFFDEVVKRMMGAFEGRCQQLYGKQASGKVPGKTKRYQVA